MLNILHITEAGGGVLEIIKNLIEIDSKNHHILLARRRDFSSQTIERSDLNFEVYFWDGNLIKALKKYRYINRLREIDIVHMHSSRAGLFRLLLFGPSKVYSPHCFAFERLDIPLVMRFVYRMVEIVLLKISDGFMGVNSFEVDWAMQEKPHINTILYEFVAHPGSRIGETRKIISVGRICKQKNPEKFAEIILSLRKKGLDVDGVWIGDGERNARRSLENCGIQVTGWLPSEEVVKYLKKSRILLHTAKWEGMPVVFFESWSIGLPIIAAEANYLRNVSQVSRFQSVAEAVELIEIELKTESKIGSKVRSEEKASQELQDFYGKLVYK